MFSGFVFCVQSSWSKNPEKFHEYWYFSLSRLTFLSNYRSEFNKQNINRKFYSRRGGIDSETIDVDPWIKILIVQNLQGINTKLIHLDYRKGASPYLLACFLSWGSQWAFWHLEKRIWMKIQSASFLHQIPDTLKNQKTFASCQFSTFYFSVSAVLIRSGKFLIKHFTPKEEDLKTTLILTPAALKSR